MPISWGVSCCVEYCSTRGKCCMKQRSMLLNYQQGGFLAEKGSVVLLYSKITQERSALFWQIETALSKKWKKKRKSFFAYIKAKSLQPCRSCFAWLQAPTHLSCAWSSSALCPGSCASPAHASATKRCSSGKIQPW